jgi:hypothetical protein
VTKGTDPKQEKGARKKREGMRRKQSLIRGQSWPRAGRRGPRRGEAERARDKMKCRERRKRRQVGVASQIAARAGLRLTRTAMKCDETASNGLVRPQNGIGNRSELLRVRCRRPLIMSNIEEHAPSVNLAVQAAHTRAPSATTNAETNGSRRRSGSRRSDYAGWKHVPQHRDVRVRVSRSR